MKKLIANASMAILATTMIFAGGVDNKTNLNAGYERNASRNTESKRPEAVFYNIGGTAFMDDGLYIGGGNQFVFKNYASEIDLPSSNPVSAVNGKYADEKVVTLYPDAEVVYKKGNSAIFFGFGVFGGGGSLEYKDGTAPTAALLFGNYAPAVIANAYSQILTGMGAAGADISNPAVQAQAMTQAQAKGIPLAASMAKNHKVDIYSVQLGEIIGISTQVTSNFSLAAAVRFMHGSQEVTLTSNEAAFIAANGGNKVGYEADGYSVGGMFGAHYKADKWDASIQYQSITRINYEYHDKTGNMVNTIITNKADAFHNDLPAVLNVGFGYNVLDNLYVSTSCNYYFNRFSTIDDPLSGEKKDFMNSWELALGADYAFNEKLSTSLGLSYGYNGTHKDVNNIFQPVLNSFVIGGGVEYKPVENLTLTGSAMYCNYFSQDYEMSGNTVELSKRVVMAALGVTYRLPF
ncbi:MAG: outer membrane protein transport protein [Treponema sp.]|nr:outer membrane protein transport protein [Candidatus Treponema equifaecale]